MSTHYFTLEEANAILPEIEPLMGKLLERRAKVVASRHLVADILESGNSDMGGQAASEMVVDFMAIERLAKRVRSYGCFIKDLNTGLVDFLSQRDGKEVYLCWRYGEPKIEFYHELHTGFAGRERV